MSTNKHIDKICIAALISILIITILFINSGKLGIQAVTAPVGYESRLFNTSNVHSIDIVMDDWDSFIENCTDESYETCAVVIDGEAYKNVAIRAKGNTSLSSVETYGNNRYSFKIEFDHYDNSNSYYGLDKLCLNNIIQDNTYMKDYLSYQMMAAADVSAPLCSYAYITVNGADWGLYLAVEAVEDAFLKRNYGNDSGNLYKPDSSNLGGGRGNGRHFEFEDEVSEASTLPSDSDNKMPETPSDFDNKMPETPSDFDSKMPETPSDSDNKVPVFPNDKRAEAPNNFDANPHDFPERFKNRPENTMGGTKGSSDVSLIYTDDEYGNYSNIFDNAKTDISDIDKERLIASLKDLNEGTNLENILDIDEVIRYFAIHNFVLNFDSYTGSMIHNYYLYEKDGRLSMIPWDYNLAFSGFTSDYDATSLVNYPIDTPILGGDIDSRPMLAWILNNEEYLTLYHQHFGSFIENFFDNGSFTDMIDSVSDMISPYVEKDPTKFCTYDEFEKGVSTLKEFCLLRAQSITAQLNGSIPTTTDEQSQETSALIDASHLTVSSMGSMGMGLGNHEKRNKNEDFVPGNFKSP